MSAIKITPADKAFSLCVRERVNYTCERCGTYAPKELSKRLDASHFHGRGKWSVRFDPDNVFACCYGCHAYLGAHPIEHMYWVQERLGPYRFEALAERARDIKRGREARRSVKEIAAHYRQELEIIREKRRECSTGRIEFAAWG